MNASGTCSSPYNADPCRNSGGGGGGGGTNGGAGNLGLGGTGGTGGNSRANASLVPLYGGCPGGDSAGYACTTSGGGGGGAVQISAAGTLTIAAGGSVTANGGVGGTSGCSAVFGRRATHTPEAAAAGDPAAPSFSRGRPSRTPAPPLSTAATEATPRPEAAAARGRRAHRRPAEGAISPPPTR